MALRGVRINLFYFFVVLLLLNNSVCLSQIIISGNPTSLCSTSSGTGNYSINPIANASYTWNVPNGMLITSGQGTNSIVSSWTATSIQAGINGNICITVDSLGTIYNTCIDVDLNDTNPTVPITIAGPASGVCKLTGVIYTCPPVSRASSYNWNIIGGGATIIGANNDTLIIVNYDSTVTTITISVNAVNSCGNGSARSLTVTGKPAPAGNITGPVTVCANQSYPFSVATVNGATTYTWTAPGGAAVTSGQGTKNIVVHFDSIPASNLTIAVKTANDCGMAATRLLNGITIISCTAGIQNYSCDFIILYPNPAHNEITVDLKTHYNNEITTDIFDVSGRVIHNTISTTDSNNLLHLNTENLSNGFYVLLLRSENFSAQKRFVIE